MSEVVSLKKYPPGEHFVEHAAEGPDVGATSRACPRLLRRRAPQQYARRVAAALSVGEFCIPMRSPSRASSNQIQQFDRLSGQLHVRGFKIAMNDATLMCVFGPTAICWAKAKPPLALAC